MSMHRGATRQMCNYPDVFTVRFSDIQARYGRPTKQQSKPHVLRFLAPGENVWGMGKPRVAHPEDPPMAYSIVLASQSFARHLHGR
jgi:hypothetical protein